MKQSKILRRRGIADAVISQLNSEDIDLVSSAIFCLGNIAAEGGEFRNDIVRKGVMNRLNQLFIHLPHETTMQQEILFFVTNCLRSSPNLQANASIVGARLCAHFLS